MKVPRWAFPAAEPATLEVARIARLGKAVTDGDGRTLFRFDEDDEWATDPKGKRAVATGLLPGNGNGHGGYGNGNNGNGVGNGGYASGGGY